MAARNRRLLVVATALSLALTLAAAAMGHEDAIAYAAPALILALPLFAGRYLGEERIARAAARVRSPRRRPLALAAPRAWLRGRARFPRGGRLIARALAVRPPPRPALR